MRALVFSKRCFIEVVKDPINIVFGLGFPIVLLFLLSAISANAPLELFKIENLAPGVAVFGISFLTLFSATLIARDKESALLQRLYTTPLKPIEFILGYTLSILPLAIVQGMACYLVALVLGLDFTFNLVLSVIALIPIAVLYVGLGLLCGSLFNVKQVGGICGALLTNLSAWLSGVWFDLELVGGAFSKIASVLPFKHAVDFERAVLSGSLDNLVSFLIVLFYALLVVSVAIFAFFKQMKRD